MIFYHVFLRDRFGILHLKIKQNTNAGLLARGAWNQWQPQIHRVRICYFIFCLSTQQNKIAPCDEHSTSSKNTNLIKTHFWRTHPLMAPRLSSTRRAAVLQWAICCRVVSPHHPQQPGAEAHLWIVPTEHYGAIPHHVKQLLREVLPIWQPIQLPTGQQHASRCEGVKM